MSLFGALLTIGQRRRQLTISSTTITFTAATVKAQPQAASNNLYTPNLLHHVQDTHLIFGLGITDYNGRPFILSYYQGLGLDRPVPINRYPLTTSDAHPRPSGIIVNDKLNVLQEHSHDTSFYIFRANTANDFYAFTKLTEEIGTSCSYPQIHTLEDGTYFVLGQVIDSSRPGGNYGDANFENWSADTQIADSGGGINTRYPTTPNQRIINQDDWRYFMINHRPSERWQQRYLFKTKDFVTFYNFDESFNTGIIIADADLSNFLAFDPGGGLTGDGYQSPAAVDNGNFFMCAYSHTLTDFVLIYRLVGEGSYTVRALGLSDYVYNVGSVTQLGAVAEIIIIHTTDIRIFVRRNPGGGNIKIYQYQSKNLGVSWTLIGDVLSDISGKDIGRFSAVSNFLDIDNNENFLFAASEYKSTALETADLYIKKAAFGAIQPDTLDPYNVTGYTFAEYNALMTRSYYSDDSLITRSGSNLTAMLDQSPSGLNTSVPSGAPQFNTSDGDFLSFSGSNQFTILTTFADVAALTQGTIMIVAKADTTTNNRKLFLVGSVIGTANKRFGVGCNKAAFNNSVHAENCLASTGSGVFTTYGDDDVGSGWHIFCYHFSNGVCSQVFIDGKKQFSNWDKPAPDSTGFNRSGSFFSAVTSISRISIGRYSSSVTEDFDFKLKHLSIMTTPMSFEQLRKSHRYLADRYGITLVSHFQ